MNIAIIIAIVGSILGCYFAACQVALKTFSRRKLADFLEARGKSARLEGLSEQLPQLSLLAGVLRTAFTIIIFLATLEIFQIGLSGDMFLADVYAFVFGGLLITIFSVAIPYSWARYQPEWLLSWSLPVLRGCRILLMPIIYPLSFFDPVIRRISGADIPTESDISDDVLSAVEQHEEADTVDEEQKDMLEAVFELPNTDAGEIMTPRTDVHGIAIDSPIEKVKQDVIAFGHSRIPIYEENLDNIVGILYAKDLIPLVGQSIPEPFDLRSVLRDPLLIPESKSVDELLTEFKARKVHLAIVVDEYGGTAGIITIEDILEEIVGEIQDEYEQQEEPEQLTRLSEHATDADARIRIDDLNDELSLELPENEDYDTLGGFVFATLGHIPTVGEQFEHQGVRFIITEAERTKVTRVKLEKLISNTNPQDM
ncbi:hemolysin family protein [Poriferisphaera sp. WC338]|uniref:hemolysin family protein n=1 Tax=Poriferisphaera sp. WC338 TaxID=3425129 RepID=UPI003D814793